MKIAFLFYNENHFHPEFFDAILSKARAEKMPIEFVGAVFTQAKFNSKRAIRQAGIFGCFKLAIKMAGKIITRTFTKPYLNSCIKTFRHHSIDIIETENANEPAASNYIKNKDVDVVFNFAPHILKKEILSSPKIICVNRHTSLLPKYKGLEPVFWALFNNEKQIGYSYHEMGTKIDNGKILYQESQDVSAADTVYSLYNKLFEMSIDGFFNTLENIKENKFVQTDVPANNKLWAYPSMNDIRTFHQKRHYI